MRNEKPHVRSPGARECRTKVDFVVTEKINKVMERNATNEERQCERA